MAGKSPSQARAAFIEPLQQALSLVTDAQFFYRPTAPAQPEVLSISADPLQLARQCGSRLLLSVQQRYEIVRTTDPDRGPWKVSTRAYRYRLDDEAGREIVAWHWHPPPFGVVPRPHLHAPRADLDHVHVPTGRVSIESVLRMLLADLGVVPLRLDWDQVLDAAEDAFLRWRTWG